MANTRDDLAAQEKITGYDEFNITIDRDAFPAEGMSPRAAKAIVNSFAWTDANPMLNLSSFVTTFAEPEAIDIAREHMFKNYIDHDMYPQVFAMEGQMVKWLHDLWNGPKGVEPYGTATIGSSEACMLGGLAHKWNWRTARAKARKDTSRPNMVTGGNVQIVWKKFMRYFDIEPRIVPLKRGNYRLTAERLEKVVDENTICVVAIAGQTFTGEDDDIQEIHDWLDAYEEKTGISVPMHIDGASGGFVNPFLFPDYKWDFRLPRVQSINASGHKFGLVPPGLGWVVFKERKIFNEDQEGDPAARPHPSAPAARGLRVLHHHERDAAHPRGRAHAESASEELQRVRRLEQGARARLGALRLHHAAGRGGGAQPARQRPLSGSRTGHGRGRRASRPGGAEDRRDQALPGGSRGRLEVCEG